MRRLFIHLALTVVVALGLTWLMDQPGSRPAITDDGEMAEAPDEAAQDEKKGRVIRVCKSVLVCDTLIETRYVLCEG